MKCLFYFPSLHTTFIYFTFQECLAVNDLLDAPPHLTHSTAIKFNMHGRASQNHLIPKINKEITV